jgi:SUF system FeS cluster assembly, SufBD
MKKPKKMIINPEWQEYQKNNEGLPYDITQAGYCMEDYLPEDYGKKLPEDGGWIMLLMTVTVASPTGVEITVPHLSMWFALPGIANIGAVKGVYPVKAIIQTPAGEVHLWPHEYNIVKDINEYLNYSEEDGVYIRFMSETGAFDKDAVFYLMARGLSRATAQQLLLGQLKDPHYCYLELHPAYGAALGEGFGMPHLTEANHSRRWAAKQRKAAQLAQSKT